MLIAAADTSRHVFVIAEAGVNHEGSFDTALRMVDEAATAGADAIKFQTYTTEHLFASDEAERFAQRRRRELDHDQFRQLAARCAERGIVFLSTPLDPASVTFLAPLVPAFKIASLDFTNYQLLQHALHYQKPLIVSCGMSDDDAVGETLAFIATSAGEDFLRRSVALLHCVSSYPAPYDAINLRSIPYLRDRYRIEVGYSDHTIGIDTCLAAASLGATIIEKHFTLDKTTPGVRDHQLSADPADLRQLIAAIRRIEAALGSPGKAVAAAEQGNVKAMRRSLYAAVDLDVGTQLTATNVRLLVPSEGIPASKYFSVLGCEVLRSIKAGQPIYEGDLSGLSR